MNELQKRLLEDYTLFNLNDPHITRFYIKYIDVLIDNFPYFKDLEVLSNYLISGNTEFNRVFEEKIERFADVVKYNRELACNPEDTFEMKELSRTLDNIEKSSSKINQLYPVDDDSGSNLLDTSDTSDSFEFKPEADEIMTQDSVVSVIQMPGFPNQGPACDDLVSNSTELVMKYYSRVMAAHISSVRVTNSLIDLLVARLEYNEINSLFLRLMHEKEFAAMLLQGNHIRSIAKKKIGCLAALLENMQTQGKGNIREDEEFIDQIDAIKDPLVQRFLAIGSAFEWVSILQDDSCLSDYSSQSNEDASTGSLQINCTTESDEIEQDFSSEESSEGFQASNSSDFQDKKEDDASFQWDSGAEELLSRVKSNELGCIIEFTDIYRILLFLCTNRGGLDIPVCSLSDVNRYTLYYIRLYSYNDICPGKKQLSFLIKLFFEHVNNTFLLTSVLKIIFKVSLNLLKSINFFEMLLENCRRYVLMDVSSFAMDGMSPSIREFTTDSIFYFLVRIYKRFQKVIEEEYSEWEDIGAMMEGYLQEEKKKSKGNDWLLPEDCEVFRRYAVEKMLSVVPFAKVFSNEENPDNGSDKGN